MQAVPPSAHICADAAPAEHHPGPAVLAVPTAEKELAVPTEPLPPAPAAAPVASALATAPTPAPAAAAAAAAAPARRRTGVAGGLLGRAMAQLPGAAASPRASVFSRLTRSSQPAQPAPSVPAPLPTVPALPAPAQVAQPAVAASTAQTAGAAQAAAPALTTATDAAFRAHPGGSVQGKGLLADGSQSTASGERGSVFSRLHRPATSPRPEVAAAPDPPRAHGRCDDSRQQHSACTGRMEARAARHPDDLPQLSRERAKPGDDDASHQQPQRQQQEEQSAQGHPSLAWRQALVAKPAPQLLRITRPSHSRHVADVSPAQPNAPLNATSAQQTSSSTTEEQADAQPTVTSMGSATFPTSSSSSVSAPAPCTSDPLSCDATGAGGTAAKPRCALTSAAWQRQAIKLAAGQGVGRRPQVGNSNHIDSLEHGAQANMCKPGSAEVARMSQGTFSTDGECASHQTLHRLSNAGEAAPAGLEPDGSASLTPLRVDESVVFSAQPVACWADDS
ncbi:hypothetical protein V8C86DRAFT_2725327 [Haematococcus lacustris]